LVCGAVFDLIAARNLIWIIAGAAALGALASLALQPLDDTRTARPGTGSASALLRDGGFLAVIVASALIQGSHAAYYIFASIAWQQAGFDGLTIAVLWVLGVIAEIVLFALSPRFTLQPSTLVMIAALSEAARWAITAQDPPLAVLARISHSVEAHRGANQRKLLCRNDFSLIQGAPRCRQSVAQNDLILEWWKVGLWKRRLMAGW